MNDFDEYIRQGEPSRREKAELWRTAIGLQAVDGLKPSQLLVEKAREHIEGTATLDDVQRHVRTYYEQRTTRMPDEQGMEEADKVSVNIARLLSAQTLAFSVFGLQQVHRNIFDGVFKFAGQIRDFNITKREWVLRGDTVTYMYAADLRPALEHDIERERQFGYGGLSTGEIIAHVAQFTADLWQIHPFAEGNTRATAVFTIQYLRSLGFAVDNGTIADNSWYFRNALVRYVYKNNDGILPEPKYLERFFRNLLLGENYELRNRYLIINPPVEWRLLPEEKEEASRGKVGDKQGTSRGKAGDKHPTSTIQVPYKYHTSTIQAGNKFLTDNPNIKLLVKAMGSKEWKRAELPGAIGLKNRSNFLDLYLTPALRDGFVRMLYPASPRHPRQRYLLTVKGIGLCDMLRKE